MSGGGGRTAPKLHLETFRHTCALDILRVATGLIEVTAEAWNGHAGHNIPQWGPLAGESEGYKGGRRQRERGRGPAAGACGFAVAGWLPGRRGGKRLCTATFLPLWLAMAGAYLVPMLA